MLVRRISGVMALGILPTGFFTYHAQGHGSSMALFDDTWACIGADDPTHGLGHYDSVLEGWVVKSPDGQHVHWGEGTVCTEVHTPAILH